jgi:hypothetical protein
MFQPKLEKSNKGQWSIKIGFKRRGDITLTPSSGREKRRPSHKSPSPTLTRDTHEGRSHKGHSLIPIKDTQVRWRLLQTPKDTILNNVSIGNMEFMTRHQPREYMTQMADPAECINQ